MLETAMPFVLAILLTIILIRQNKIAAKISKPSEYPEFDKTLRTTTGGLGNTQTRRFYHKNGKFADGIRKHINDLEQGGPSA